MLESRWSSPLLIFLHQQLHTAAAWTHWGICFLFVVNIIMFARQSLPYYLSVSFRLSLCQQIRLPVTWKQIGILEQSVTAESRLVQREVTVQTKLVSTVFLWKSRGARVMLWCSTWGCVDTFLFYCLLTCFCQLSINYSWIWMNIKKNQIHCKQTAIFFFFHQVMMNYSKFDSSV